MICCLEVEAVIALNAKFTNGGGVLRDRGGLESALARPLHTPFGQPVYPTVIEKAAALLHGIATTQYFVDGNKRTAWMACLVFLREHGMRLVDGMDGYADDFVVGVATGQISQQEVVTWLLDHIEE